MPNAQQRDRQRQMARWREDEKAVDESQKGTTRALEEPSKRRQHSGICGRKPRLPVVRPSPVDKSRWAVTLANDHRPSPLHLGSIESWCNADPPTPRWHTPLTLVRGQALRWTPSSTPNRKSVLVRAWSRNKYRPRAMGLFFAAELLRTIRETACLQACKQCAPNCGAGAVAEETCRCWQEEGSSIAAAFRPLRAKDGRISPLASRS
ncbi:hypothetical protein CFAM422_010608 [Trichoderma lentiforme]|uniref:Uncharacterized protein n=1 Tax=Trichoderma lentiforme TaxID=1567552 RepID=A0A9P4X7D6_9HYPO|nr:hypothetical protein CFAM422_010608 [Trichoderma lentiforme]